MPFAKNAKATPTYFRARSGALDSKGEKVPTGKNGLLGQLKHQETALELSLGMMALIQVPEAMRLLKNQQIYITDRGVTNFPDNGSIGYKFDFVNCEGLAEFCHSRAENPTKEFLKSAFRNLLTVSWELIWVYCRETHQEEKLTSQPWYQFFRIIRNSLSHDFRFNVPKDKTGEFVTGVWRGKTISGNDHGTLVPIAFLGYDGLYEIFIDLKVFVEKDLV